MKAFLDANIFMYAVGREHPHKRPCVRLLERLAEEEWEGATDSEALQEILYRYWHLGLAPQGITLVERVVQIVPSILPVERTDVLLAADLLRQHAAIEPRDAIHAAVMVNNGLDRIYSFDRHFDRVEGLKRLEPPA